MEVYESGKNIINLIQEKRKEISFEQRNVENATFRLSLSQSDMWERVQLEHYTKLEVAQEEYKKLYRNFISLKSLCSKEEWEQLLSQLGTVLAQTERVNHIVDSMYDESDLKKALDQTETIIIKEYGNLKEAVEMNDQDSIIIISSKLDYFENDMKKHHWGEARLKNIHLQIDNIIK